MLADFLTIAAVIGILWVVGYGCYMAGRDSAERRSQSTIASNRAKIRRLERDLFLAYEENRALRQRAVPYE